MIGVVAGVVTLVVTTVPPIVVTAADTQAARTMGAAKIEKSILDD